MQHLVVWVLLVTSAFVTVFCVTVALSLQNEASAPAEFNKWQLYVHIYRVQLSIACSVHAC
jgi:hypothetical protein